MREIRFRAWNRKLGRFMTDDDPQPILHPDGHIDFGQYRFYVDGLDYTEDDIEINLWTGLYDREGREIYEGDIVKKSGIFYEVIFKPPCFRLKPLDKTLKDVLALSVVAKHSEVVGNIYENPGLLTEANHDNNT